MKSESFRKQALCLVLFFAAVAAVFALTRLRSDPAKKQAEFVVQQLLSCSCLLYTSPSPRDRG